MVASLCSGLLNSSCGNGPYLVTIGVLVKCWLGCVWGKAVSRAKGVGGERERERERERVSPNQSTAEIHVYQVLLTSRDERDRRRQGQRDREFQLLR